MDPNRTACSDWGRHMKNVLVLVKPWSFLEGKTSRSPNVVVFNKRIEPYTESQWHWRMWCNPNASNYSVHIQNGFFVIRQRQWLTDEVDYLIHPSMACVCLYALTEVCRPQTTGTTSVEWFELSLKEVLLSLLDECRTRTYQLVVWHYVIPYSIHALLLSTVFFCKYVGTTDVFTSLKRGTK